MCFLLFVWLVLHYWTILLQLTKKIPKNIKNSNVNIIPSKSFQKSTPLNSLSLYHSHLRSPPNQSDAFCSRTPSLRTHRKLALAPGPEGCWKNFRTKSKNRQIPRTNLQIKFGSAQKTMLEKFKLFL